MEILIQKIIPDHKNTSNPDVRQKFGNLASIVGLLVNFLLFAFKLLAGFLTGSISIIGEAINNLSDFGSSLIALVSFHISSKPADEKHPFGHGRAEYVFSSVVALAVIVIGVQLAIESVKKIINPVSISFSWISVIILAVSILAKMGLYYFFSDIADRIKSDLIRANALDSRSDVMSTVVVLISLMARLVTDIPLDGWLGAFVSVLIMRSGWEILAGIYDRILGHAPSAKQVQTIENFVMSYEDILGVHDLIVHDYGPGRSFASIHAEVNASTDIMDSHDLIDRIERDAILELGVQLIIHMDPLDIDNPLNQKLYEITLNFLHEVDPLLSMHDFRYVKSDTYTNLLFDVDVPPECDLTDEEIVHALTLVFDAYNPNLVPIITIDRNYIRTEM